MQLEENTSGGRQPVLPLVQINYRTVVKDEVGCPGWLAGPDWSSDAGSLPVSSSVSIFSHPIYQINCTPNKPGWV